MIDTSLLTARDFIGIRAELVSALGNDMNRAGVLTRIYWRCNDMNREAHEDEGTYWWRTTYARIAAETGLNEQQVRRVVKWLIEKGHLETREFRFNGITDRTLSFRVITSLSESTDGLSESTDSVSESTPQSLSESTDLPSIKKEDILSDQEFEVFWQVYPRHVAKSVARKSWASAIKKAKPEVITAAAARYAKSVSGSEERFIAHPSTWLNQERWDDFAGKPATKPVDWMNAPREKAGWEKLRDGER